MRKYLIACAVALAVLALDQATKLWVVADFRPGESVDVLSVFALTYVRNQGAAWGMFQGAQLWLAGVGVLAVVLCFVFWRKIFGDHAWAAPVAGLLLGGIIGNLIDRVRLGYVIDFLDFHWGVSHFPCFNIADSAICIGVFALIVLQWVYGESGENGERKTERAGAKRQTFHGHGTRDERATGKVEGES